MKKLRVLAVVLFIMVITSAAGAKEGDHYNWSQHDAYKSKIWRQVDIHKDEPETFKWRERLDYYAYNYNAQLIRERKSDWANKFPGLRPYSWSGNFLYHGNRIAKSVMLYTESYELVGVVFMNNGVLTFIRDDQKSFETDDASFLSLFNSAFKVLQPLPK